MDAVAALPSGAAQGRIYLGHRRIFLPGDHAGRRHADHRDGGDERLPQGTARQDPGRERAFADPAARIPAHRLAAGGRPCVAGRGHQAGRAHRRGPGAGVVAVQCLRRAGARHARRRSRQASLDRHQHQAGHARGLRPGAGGGDRPQARRSALAARRRQHHAGGAARRGDADGDDAAHQVLQDRRRVRGRHVRIRHRVRVHADARGAGLFQPLRRRDRHRGLRRQSRPGRSLPQARHRGRRRGRSS